MMKCIDCELIFETPATKRICFEQEYGVANLFESRTYTNVDICPACNSQNLEELEQCEICEEWFKSEDLTDTEGMVGGGCGYACPQCLEDCEIY